MSLCRCGQYGRHHEVTNACLSPEDQKFVRAVEVALDELENPWWHQVAGRDDATSVASERVATAAGDRPA